MTLRGVLPFLAAPFLMAGWPPIPPQVWALKVDPADGPPGAVVLESNLTFKNTYIEHLYRVRILNESGKDAAQFAEFPEDAYDFEGRTVYRDGREVTFSKVKDLATQTLAAGWDETTRKVVIPPGVTGDCIVEFRWKESGKPLPKRLKTYGHWAQGSKYRTLLSSVTVPVSFPWTFQFFMGRVTPSERVVKGNQISFVTRDLPGDWGAFYTLRYLDNPRFAAFSQPKELQDVARTGQVPEYWSKAAKFVLKGAFLDRTTLGRHYRELARTVCEGLPAEPQARATAILERMEGKIRNLDLLTYDEDAAQQKAREKEKVKDPIVPFDLDAAAQTQETDGLGMVLLYVNLLKGAGVDPKLALVRNRNQGIFEYGFASLHQAQVFLVGVDEPGKPTLWMNPEARYSPPGILDSDYQGTPCLFVDTRTWDTTPGSIPFQSRDVNRRHFDYRVEPGDEQCLFTLKAAHAGLPALRERDHFLPMSQALQDENLKTSLEARYPAAKITSAKVLNATDPSRTVAFDAAGTVPLEEGRRIQLAPFPCMPPPLWIPQSFPETRKERIVLPYSRIQTAECVMKVPPGYRLAPTEDMRMANGLGRVTWVAEALGAEEVKITFKVEVVVTSTGPGSYGAFRTFLGWIDEAMRRRVLMEKV